MTITIKFVFSEDGKFYPQLFLDLALYELQYQKCYSIKNYLPEGIDINKTSASKEYELCHYWFFKDVGSK